MSVRLFRQQAIEAQREPLYGEIVVASPLTVSLLTVTALVIVVVLGGWLYWGEYTRKAHIPGYLAPTEGLIKLYPPQAGVVSEQPVQEGQAVTRDQVLLVLSSERGSRETRETQGEIIARLTERRDSLERELALQAQMDRIELDNQRDRLRGLEGELAQFRQEQATQQRRVATARDRERRLADLAGRGFVPRVQWQEARDLLLDQQLDWQRIQREAGRLEREIESLERDLPAQELQGENRRSAIRREIAALEQQLTESESRRNTVITAPREGTVTTLLAQPGQAVTPGTPLLSILPKGSRLQARLLVPSRSAGFIRVGQQVTLRYQAFPYQRFGGQPGTISRIARTLLIPGEVQLPVTLTEPVYLVDVDLESTTIRAYRDPVPLQAGMLLEADVHLDRRRLVEWLLEPLFSLGGRL